MHIGERIKAKRISLGWSQRDLAEKMGYKNHSVIARIEAGTVDLPQSRVDQFAKVLGLSHGYLLGLISEAQSNQNTHNARLTGKIIKDPVFNRAVTNLDKLQEINPEGFENVNALIATLIQQ